MQTKRNNMEMLVVDVPATIASISKETYQLNNDKKTPFRMVNADISYPNGNKATVASRLYQKSLEAHPEVFQVGKGVTLEVQAEGDYMGRSVVKLPANQVDVNMMLGITNISTTTTQENVDLAQAETIEEEVTAEA